MIRASRAVNPRLESVNTPVSWASIKGWYDDIVGAHISAQQRVEGKDATSTLIVGMKDKYHILHCDEERESPNDDRQDPQEIII